jgi:opacity protein-like surface antigen
MAYRVMVAAAMVMLMAGPGMAQGDEPAIEVGATFVTTRSGQFHTKDLGIGGWVAWRPNPLISVEGELTYHGDPFNEAQSFSNGRIEGLFGATVGPRLGTLRPFAIARPGFVTFRAANEALTCIAIFPPPLSCTLADGKTVFAFDLGGGLEVSPTSRTVIRVALSDRMLRYPAASFDTNGIRHDDSFIGHDFRVAVGAGFRF